MGRAPCCEKVGLKRGRWTPEEDEILMKYIEANGEGSWRSLPKNAGLLRCGKSCRLRWFNYLKAGIKRGNFSSEENEMIIKLHKSLGSKWSLMAGNLPGRTDNEKKNYWNSHLSRRMHSFIRSPISRSRSRSINIPNEPSSLVVMDYLASKLSNIHNVTLKPKGGGRKSRSAMKKNNNKIPSNVILKMPSVDNQKTGCEGDDDITMSLMTSTQEKKTPRSTTVTGEEVEGTKSVILDSYEEGEERESFNPSPYHKDRESQLFAVMCPNDITGNEIMLLADGGSIFNEERENGDMGSDDQHQQEAGIVLMDSNNKVATTTGHDQETSNNMNCVLSSMTTSSLENEWLEINVTEELKVEDERKEMLSWLWDEMMMSDNDGGDETAAKLDSEMQQALADWLLS